MNSFIDIRYNIFTEKEIINFLFYFYQNEKRHSKYNKTVTLPLEDSHKHFLMKKYEPFIANNIIDWAQIVKWPQGAGQDYHCDLASDNTTLSSITYLNHDFVGGETVFNEGTIIQASKNKTIFFTGRNIEHGVKKVLGGVRYTIATWYKLK